MKRQISFLVAGMPAAIPVTGAYTRSSLPGTPNNGAGQDNIFSLNRDTGRARNGSGWIFRTLSSSSTRIKQRNSPGTYFRTAAYPNAQIGFAIRMGTKNLRSVTHSDLHYRSIECDKTRKKTNPATSGKKSAFT